MLSAVRFFLGTWHMSGFLSENRPIKTLREVLNRLQETYCGNIGYEYMHIPDRDRCNWLRERIETPELVRSLCWRVASTAGYQCGILAWSFICKSECQLVK